MSLKEKLSEDLKQAMKARDETKIRTIRLLIAAIKNFEVEKLGQATDDDVLQIMSKEVKKRLESIEMYRQAKREDLAIEEENELKIIKSYMPEQMSEDQIRELAKKLIQQYNLSSPKDIGTVMKLIMPQVKGKADGKLVNKIVQELLGG
ncbi:GatB/YqeY domain-containing protein [Thermotoga profunda]|uniref:GatB/YqeY domain-containing protein n=1 Tax=Thermotoga profunda TaxID=1508420 RepID=UPI0005978F9C|nr:GatB/YqeY domain-containing protein [Thermotoga profunda]